jgi:hypothetical protein
MARRGSARTLRILLGIGILIFFVSYLVWSLRQEEIFHVLNNRLEQTEAGIVVSGEVYNASSKTATVNVEVLFFDGNGHQLAKEVLVLEALAVGASAPFRTAPRLLTEMKDYTIYLNTGRNMYGN